MSRLPPAGSRPSFAPALAGVLLLLSLFLTAAPARADDQAIFVAPRDTPDQVTVSVIVPYEASVAGLAHFTEHLVWHSAIRGRGADSNPHSNAITRSKYVEYYLAGKRKDLDGILRTLAGVFNPIELAEDFVLEERDIVLREHDIGILNNPNEQAIMEMDRFLYAGNGLAYSIMGTAEEIRALTFADAKRLQEATHRPERSILFATGDITEEEFRQALTRAAFPPVAPRAALRPMPVSLAPPDEQIITLAAGDAAPRMLWRKVVRLPEPVPFDNLTYQASVLGAIFRSSLEGGLARPLLFDASIARNIEASVTALDESHVVVEVTAEPDRGVRFATLRAALETALANAAKGIPAASVARILKRFGAELPDTGDRRASLNWVADTAYQRLVDQRPVVSEGRLRALLSEIAPAAIDALAAAITAPGRISVAFIGKDNG